MSLAAKICGLTRREDAAFAAGAGADLLGFVLHPPSPRHCPDLGIASAFLDRAVLVMVANQAEPVIRMARRYGFRRVQPHLPRSGRGEAALRLKAEGLFLLWPWADEPGQEAIPADLYLWEPSPTDTGLPGGSGRPHPMAFPPPGPFLLAGGLEASSLAGRAASLPPAARRQLRGFDAASRLESGPGRKDPARVAAFLRAAHALELP